MVDTGPYTNQRCVSLRGHLGTRKAELIQLDPGLVPIGSNPSLDIKSAMHLQVGVQRLHFNGWSRRQGPPCAASRRGRRSAATPCRRTRRRVSSESMPPMKFKYGNCGGSGNKSLGRELCRGEGVQALTVLCVQVQEPERWVRASPRIPAFDPPEGTLQGFGETRVVAADPGRRCADPVATFCPLLICLLRGTHGSVNQLMAM